MLSNKQKRYLRAESHSVQPIFQVGKGGINENMVVQINEALEARELIKVTVLQNCLDDKHEIANALSDKAKAHIVQVIGNVIILFKQSIENPRMQLPSN